MEVLKKLNFLTLLLCIYLALTYPNSETAKDYYRSSSDFVGGFSDPAALAHDFQSSLISLAWSNYDDFNSRSAGQESLQYNFYHDTCPKAEKIVKEIIRQVYNVRPDLGPALIRLLFHDCFIKGCDASILLDGTEGMESEKDTPPNETLKGFEVIDIIKEEVENVCPGTVSCADIIVLAAREALLQAGGPYYPVTTGRRDSMISYAQLAMYQLPSPYGDLDDVLASFSARGFDERETVNLLGAHSIGIIHCKSFHSRLYNFSGTNKPDPSLDPGFLDTLRSRCGNISSHLLTAPSASPSPSPAPSPCRSSFKSPQSPIEEPGVAMDHKGTRREFGTSYFRSLLQGRGILYADQQLMSREETRNWVRAYAWDAVLFRKDFSDAMMKLSNLNVLTAPDGQIRRNCSKVA
ncbi:hypothetical protein MLD38_004886 [Melastoma candidum]|uniref:Uncharacterized protein n=1 Tax=Melastoma candidum TaxID=119954 RepID=A0ACB9SB23_9MYRT|nr:hypothetical protein MLD38_004886 [Melastoma candidum]